MAYLFSPKIATDGLVLCLDAADKNSYPGSGTAWYDLSANEYDATLVNSPTVSSQGITLDGVNDYITIAHSGNLSFTNGILSVCVWHKNLDSDTGFNAIITNDVSGDRAWRIHRDNGNGFYTARSYASSGQANFPSYTVGKFHMYSFTLGSGTLQTYFDGVAGNSVTSVTNPLSYDNLTFGSYRYNNATSGQYLENQVIGCAHIYNRVLSDKEILQNFNAQRTRFGI
jgi:hypothetical protein